MAKTVCRSCGTDVVPFAELCPNCGTSRPTDEFLGRTLRGNIEIQELIGSGAMGDVYRGRQTTIDRDVAVKVLNNVSLNDDRIVSFFMREAKVLSKLRHPNLVSVIDFGQEEDGTLFLVMELVPGTSLERMIRKEAPFSLSRASRIVVQILRALSEVHRHNVVHCDLKPDNVLIEDVAGFEDFVKVVDFGVATLLDADRATRKSNTEANDVYGTPQYMSPEQAMGQGLDGRTDVYAAGVLLYEMMTGTLPHSGDDLLDLLVNKISSDAPLPSQRSPDLAIPPAFDRICQRSMQRDLSKRYNSADEMREELEHAIANINRPTSPGFPASVDLTSSSQSTPVLPRKKAETFHGKPGKRPRDFRQITVMAVRPVIQHGAETGASTEEARLDGVWDLVRRIANATGGKAGEPSGGLILVSYEESTGTPALVRAARAALRLRQQAVRGLSFARLGIALTKGDVTEISGHGSGSFREPSGQAIDDVRALAARTKGHQILVTAGHEKLLSPLFVSAKSGDSLELIDHRGGERSTRGISAVGGALLATHSHIGRHPDVFGRTAQKNRVDQLVETIAAGREGASLLLVGPDGMGKTTLADHARAKARTAGLPILNAYCHNRLVDRPFRPLLDLALQAAGVVADDNDGLESVDTAAFRRGLILAGLAEFDADVILEQFCAGTSQDPQADKAPEGLLSYGQLSASLHRFPSSDRRHVFTVAIRNLIRHVAGSGGVLMIIEDLHLSDVSSVRCLAAICELVSTLPVAFICTSTSNRIGGLQLFEPLVLGPMNETESAAVFDGLIAKLGHSANLEKERERVLQGAQGSPLFIARWLESPLRNQDPPQAVQELLHQQFESLPGRLQRLLLVTSVVGEYFERPVLEGLFPRSASIGAALDGAMVGGLLEPCPGVDGLWRFRHAWIRRVIYNNIPEQERIRYHHNVFEGLSKFDDGTGRTLLVKATHADRGELKTRALNLTEKLGDRFTISGDPAVGEYWYARALTAARRAMDAGEPVNPRRLNQLILKAAEAFCQAKHFKRAAQLLSQMQPGNAREDALRRLVMGRALLKLGDVQRAWNTIGGGRADFARKDAAGIGLIAMAAEMCVEKSKVSQALELLRPVIEEVATNSIGLPDDLSWMRWHMLRLYGRVAVADNEAAQGEAALRDGFILARVAGDGLSLVSVLEVLADHLLDRHKPEDVIDLCKDALDAEQIALRLPQRLAVYRILHRAHLALYDSKTAQKSLRKALVIAHELGWTEMANQLAEELDRA